MENFVFHFLFWMCKRMLSANFQLSTFNFPFADCHMHMLLDGMDWRAAIDGHRENPDRELIRDRLQSYADAGFDYLRDGGDRWGVGTAAREMAPEFGITYRTPLSPLCKTGHYGAFIGEKFSDFREFAELVRKTRQDGGDFIKIMVSGLMDFDCFGRLTEEPLTPGEITELVHIVHEEGFTVMLHANGARTVEACALAGADSVEHGAYLDEDALCAMVENGTIWCPTLSTVGNLREKGRFDEKAVRAIYDSAVENVHAFARMGGIVAPGSDAGAWAVPHVQGGVDEYVHLRTAIGKDWETVLARGIGETRRRF